MNRSSLPQALRTTPFSVAQARALGVGPGVLRNPGLSTPTSGARIPPDSPDDLHARCTAIAQVLPADAVFSHGTALRLLGVDRPWPIDRDDSVHVVVRDDGRRPQRAGITAHWTKRPVRRVTVAGLRVTTGVQAWAHLAGTIEPDEVVVLADVLVRRTAPPATTSQLRAMVAGLPAGTRGQRRLRRALELLRPGTDSPMETRTRLVLLSAGLPCPEVNTPAFAPPGTFLALPDMSYPELRIAIEYDGDVHRTDPATWRRDVERRQRLEEAGWIIITATADDVLRHPERLIARVRRALRTRTASPRVGYSSI